MPFFSFQCKHWKRNTLLYIAKLASNSHCILTAPSFIGPLPPAARLSFCACSLCLLSSLFFFASSALLGLSCPQSSKSHSSWPQSSSGISLLRASAAGALLVSGDSSNDPQSPTSHASSSDCFDCGGLSAFSFFLLCWDFRFPEPVAAVLLFIYGWTKISYSLWISLQDQVDSSRNR